MLKNCIQKTGPQQVTIVKKQEAKMTDPNDNSSPNLGDDIRQLGKSLGDFFKSAWESEERKEMEEGITGALQEVANTFQQLADDLTNGETGQQLKTEYEDLKQRVDSGEFKEKARSEFSKAIQQIKEELDEISSKWKPETEQESDPDSH
jgi:hypothetical protein